MDLSLPLKNSPDVEFRKIVVVGAGIAGLAATYELQKRGFDVVLLEAQNYAGGRIRTVHADGYHAESGASVVTTSETETLTLLKELSVGPLIDLGLHGLDLFFGRQFVRLGRLDGRVRDPRDLWSLLSFFTAMATSGEKKTFPQISLLQGYRAALKAIEQEQSFLHFPYDSKARPDWDTTTFADFLDRFHPSLRTFVDIQLKVTAGEAADQISLFWGLVTFNWNIDGSFYWINGGASSLPLAVAKQLGNRIRLNSPVKSVSTDHSMVRVQYETEAGPATLSADAVLFAAPPSAVLSMVESISERKKEALAGVRFGSYLVAHFVCRKRFWTGKIKSGYLNCGTTVFADILDSTKGQEGEGGILTAFIAGPEARRLIDAPDSTIICEVVRDLDRVFPGFIRETTNCLVDRWREAIPYFHPGYGGFIEELKQPEGRLFFCGDYTQGAGIQDAVVSGLRAAEQIVGFLSNGK